MSSAKSTQILEEIANSSSHILGFLMGIAGSVVLIINCPRGFLNIQQKASLFAFQFSLLILFACSAAYHSCTNIRWKHHFRQADHAAIFIYIAGTYSAYCLLPDHIESGLLLMHVWALALAGVVFKLFFAGRWPFLSTLLYLLLGWLIIWYRHVLEALPHETLLFLIAGGLSYTCGTFFYMWRKLPFHHLIWHIWVIFGSIFHYLGILSILKKWV